MSAFFDQCRLLGLTVIETEFEDYLQDESRFRGHADALVRPGTQAEVAEVVTLANGFNTRLTVVSGKTSLTGGPVPAGGAILDLKGLERIDPEDPSIVEPGVILRHYKDWVAARGLFFPPDPTSEESCTLGGAVACNASGALSYLYGPTRDYVRGLKVVLPTGSVLEVMRGDVTSRDGVFIVPGHMLSPRQQAELVIPVPRIKSLPWRVCKNAAGIFSSDPMDLVDLFIGSEGILGVVVEIRTVLVPSRKPRFGLMLYLSTLERTVEVVTLLDVLRRLFHDKDITAKGSVEGVLRELGIADFAALDRFSRVFPSCMEWFHRSVADFLSPDRARRHRDYYGALYIEQEYSENQGLMESAEHWAELVELLNASDEGQSLPIKTEVALDEKQIRSLKTERKGVPEKLNERIQPGMVKMAMDFSVPMEHLKRLLELYDRKLPSGRAYVFGHIGNAHLHVNLLPQNAKEQEEDGLLYMDLAREVCSMGGSVSGEHGIGKLKHEALEIMLGAEGIEEIRRLKKIMDPNGILNIGNMVSMS